MSIVRATYRTSTVNPTIYYTALNTDGSTLTSRSTVGLFHITGDLFGYDQPATADFIAQWDEGDLTNVAEEYIVYTPGGNSGGAALPQGYVPIVILGPDGSPNGTLAAAPQTVVVTSSGEVFVKSIGAGVEGWIQTQDS